MKYRQFGPLKVSEIFFGAMRYHRGVAGAAADMKVAQAALNEALDLGVNVIHSSFEYGSQELTGRFLHDRPERRALLHMVKSPTDPTGLTVESFGRWLDEQLELLHTERIAILQVRAKTWELERQMYELALPYVQSGKITTTAAFAYDDDIARAAVADGRVNGLAAYVNPMYLFAGDAYALLKKAGKQMIAFQPLAEGAMSDSRTTWEALPAGDRLKNDRGKLFLEHRARVEKLLKKKPDSWVRFAMGFVLGRPQTAGVVTSMNTPQQVRSLVEATDATPVDEATYLKLVELFRQHLADKVYK